MIIKEYVYAYISKLLFIKAQMEATASFAKLDLFNTTCQRINSSVIHPKTWDPFHDPCWAPTTTSGSS